MRDEGLDGSRDGGAADAEPEVAALLREISGPAPAAAAAARIADGAWRDAAPASPSIPAVPARPPFPGLAPWAVRAAAWLGAAAAGFTFAAWPTGTGVALRLELSASSATTAPRDGGAAPGTIPGPAPAVGPVVFHVSVRLEGGHGEPVVAAAARDPAEAEEALLRAVVRLSRALEASPPREVLHARSGSRTRVVVGAGRVLLEKDGVAEEFPSAEALRAARPEVAAEFGSRLDP